MNEISISDCYFGFRFVNLNFYDFRFTDDIFAISIVEFRLSFRFADEIFSGCNLTNDIFRKIFLYDENMARQSWRVLLSPIQNIGRENGQKRPF